MRQASMWEPAALVAALLGAWPLQAFADVFAVERNVGAINISNTQEADMVPKRFISVTPLTGPELYADAILEAARLSELSPALILALVAQESGWRAGAISPKGAIGLTQLMPETARELKVDPYDPAENLKGGALYLRQQLDRFDGNLDLALAAYNAGPTRVKKAGGIPANKETKNYVSSIFDKLSSPQPRDRH